MIVAIFIIILFLQLISYTLIDSKKINIRKLWVLLILLLFYCILLPIILYQIEFNNLEKGTKCGLPVLGMIGACWLFGGGITIVGHLVYFLVKKLLSNG